MTRLAHRDHSVLTGIWLTHGPVESSIDTLLLQMLEPTLPHPTLRQALLDELNRKVKPKDIVLEYLGLREVGMDSGHDVVLYLAASDQTKDPWQDALLRHQGDCPIGFVFNSLDHGRVVVVTSRSNFSEDPSPVDGCGDEPRTGVTGSINVFDPTTGRFINAPMSTPGENCFEDGDILDLDVDPFCSSHASAASSAFSNTS